MMPHAFFAMPHAFPPVARTVRTQSHAGHPCPALRRLFPLMGRHTVSSILTVAKDLPVAKPAPAYTVYAVYIRRNITKDSSNPAQTPPPCYLVNPSKNGVNYSYYIAYGDTFQSFFAVSKGLQPSAAAPNTGKRRYQGISTAFGFSSFLISSVFIRIS